MESEAAVIPDGLPPIDRAQVFLLFSTFAGDVERTAHASGLSPSAVIDLATNQGWNEKLKAILALKRSAAPGDVERGLNRAMNFVQAHRMRLFVDRLLLKLSNMDNNELDEYFFTGRETQLSRKPKALSTRALADLASAMEKCSTMTYQALADTATDRAGRDEGEGGGDSSGAIHAAIAKAMSEVGRDLSPAGLLADAQLAVAKQIAPESCNPHDNDDH